jgi:hypothetical protein
MPMFIIAISLSETSKASEASNLVGEQGGLYERKIFTQDRGLDSGIVGAPRSCNFVEHDGAGSATNRSGPAVSTNLPAVL